MIKLDLNVVLSCNISVWVFCYFDIKNCTFIKSCLDLGSICVVGGNICQKKETEREDIRLEKSQIKITFD